jgi:hypothetical protein
MYSGIAIAPVTFARPPLENSGRLFGLKRTCLPSIVLDFAISPRQTSRSSDLVSDPSSVFLMQFELNGWSVIGDRQRVNSDRNLLLHSVFGKIE